MDFEEKFQQAAKLAQAQQDDQAILLLLDLIDERPDDARLYAVLGEAALNRRNFREAVAALKLSLTLEDNPFVTITLANAYTNQGKLSQASKLLDEVRPAFMGTRDVPLWTWSKAEVLRCLGQYDQAEELLRYTIQEAPNWSVPWGSLGILEIRRHNYEAAVAYFARQYELNPNYKTAHGLGINLLYIGSWRSAHKFWRMAAEEKFKGSQFGSIPMWDGKPVKTLAVYGDGGLGDTVQYARYLPKAKEKAERVIFIPQNRHIDIVRRMDLPGVEIGTPGDYDAASWLMTLAGELELYFPSQAPAPVRLNYERIEMPENSIALSWFGDVNHANDKLRSVRLKDFAAIVRAYPQYHWFTVSPGKRVKKQIADSGLPITQYSGSLDEACQRLCQAKAYVGVDTGHAHVTATQGIPTHMIFKDFVDSRWMAAGETSAFYPSLKLYRSYETTWADAIAKATDNLKELS